MNNTESVPNPLGPEAQLHYLAGKEKTRLLRSSGLIEQARTKELLARFLPPPPTRVLDIGGGTGIYAFWLAEQGYEVVLQDAMPLHIKEAEQFAAEHKLILAKMEVGDARKLNEPDRSAEAVMLFGPLYHLTEKMDRLVALREAARVLKPGGVVLAVGISRYASLLDGLSSGMLEDSEFAQIVERDLLDGQHRNPNNHPAYFTTTYFHHPRELTEEVKAAGFTVNETIAIEGPFWLSEYAVSNWEQPESRELFLKLLRRVETEPALLGVSAHFMVVGRRDS